MKTFQESVEIKLKFSLSSSEGKSESIYFDGDKYESVERWATNVVETEEECMNEKYDVSTKDRYYFTGRFCKFLGSKDKDYGYKIFMDENLEERHIRLLFEIQDLLSENGFAQEVLGGIQGGGYGTRFQETPSQSPLQQALGAGLMGAGILGALR